MAFSLSSSSTALAAGVVLTVLTLLYRAALPKPIPGIPYNHASARSIFGDIPGMMKWKKDTRETFTWMTEQCRQLNAPMVQVFVKPFALPWVIVADARECQDVLTRRSREFDRSAFTTDVVLPILREHHFPFPSGPKQRAHRALLSDLMAPAFLNEVAAPRLYDATLELLQLWRRKAMLADSHPFAAHEDIANAALDTIWAASVGREARTTTSQIEVLAQCSALELPAKQDLPAVFPQAPVPFDVQCIRTAVNSMEVGLASPLPGLSYFFYLKLPGVRRAFNRKDRMLSVALKDSRDRLGIEVEKGIGNAPVHSAMDYILRRELLQARKEGRPPRLDDTVLKDELFGFLLAGHETTSTTLMWGMKFLTDHQDVQRRLREALRDAIPAAAAEGRQPSYVEITTSSCPYLDAVIEEMLRCGGTAAAQARQCLVETELLGVRLPKGTNVLFMTNGPSFIAPAMPVDEQLRSQTSREARGKIGEWDPEDLAQFKPERWLTTDSEGRVGIDVQAGPNTQFGGGARGCFGKKFAYLEMRTVMTIIFWNFKLLPVPAELSSYSAFDSVAHVPQLCYIRLAPA
ncbi:related to TRI13-cytochrome P450 [Phialocephala subalpina]|uniref:Related to TRI13-cytochrome P450 n=1 Tax=Phialocephala subalpina TaxID=576137 RepID=A0A1L7XJC5_9HELO|nr:related to TRI13-cytochrome P450 [Phialocephala subalpina]